MFTSRAGSILTMVAAVLVAGASARAAEDAAPATAPASGETGLSAFVRGVQKDTGWLASYSTRAVGTVEHDRAVRDMLARVNEAIRDQPGVRIWPHRFKVVAPRTIRAELHIADGPSRGTHRVYPIWPANVRPNTTPKEGIEGDLVYVGRGSYRELKPRSLRGQIAVMEMTGGGNWQSAHSAGARAIVLLGSPEERQKQAHSHVTRLPINVPRFYVPAGPLADQLRAAPSSQAGEEQFSRGRLFVQVKFARRTATNIYVLVRPGQGGQSGPAIAYAAAYDSMGVVPDLAPGADVAVDAAVLLGVLDHFVANRPAHPLLFAFVDAFGINQIGCREMLAALSASPNDRKVYRVEEQAKKEKCESRNRLLDELGTGQQALERVHEGRYASLQRYVKDEVAREVVAIETVLEPIRLKLYGRDVPNREQLEAEVEKLAGRRSAYYAAQLQLLTSRGVGKSEATLARGLREAVTSRIKGELADVNELLAVDAERTRLWDQMRAELGLGGATRPLAFLVGLDLSDAGVSVGPRLFCAHLKLKETGNAKDFLRWLRNIEENESQTVWPGAQAGAVNLAPLRGWGAPESYSVGAAANLTSPASSFGTPAATWATLDCLRERVDTPRDRADLLDWRRLAPQIDATFSLLKRLGEKADFQRTSSLPARWTRVRGAVVDQSPGEPVPRVPMHGYLTSLLNGRARGGQITYATRVTAEGVRLDEFVFTGTDGMFYFDAIPIGTLTSERGGFATYTLQSYELADDGRIIRAVDMNKVGKGVRLDVDLTERNASPRRAVVFTCQEVSALGLFDPRFLLNLPYGSVLDARRAGRPQRMNFSLYGGQWSCMLEPGIRWQLVLRAGSTENRMALLNVLPPEQAKGLSLRETMRGFDLGKPLPHSPTETSARDLERLDERRITDYRGAGITSEAIDAIHSRTRKMLEQARQAWERNDGQGLYKAASGALSNEVRAYQAVKALANDVVRAAIFLLLALVPFSYAMERLLFGSPNVYRQLGGVVGVFLLMTAVLWSFHPAFRISNQPLMIIMAFGIIFMSLLVMSIVYQRFKSQLEEMRSGRAESSGARTSRGGLAISAIRLGIANMRKRKLRTALTGVTVMLITFALLCFTSVSSYIGHKERSLSTESSFTGLWIRQPQSRAMPAEALPCVRTAMSGAIRVVPRYWWCRPLMPQWRINVSSSMREGLNFGRTFNEWFSAMVGGVRWSRNEVPLNAALGLAAGEEAVSGIDRVLKRWDRFIEKGGCYLSNEAAEQLGVKPGDTVVVAGKDLELIDAFDPVELEKIRTMTGETLMPTNFSALGEEQRRLLAGQSQEQLISEMASGTGLEPDQQLPRLSAAFVLILPAEMVASLPGRDGSLRNICVQTESMAKAREAATEMVNRVALPIYFGSPEEVNVIASTPLTPKGPKSLLIMLVIAGLIIFNTMLNSIAERKKEVHIYSSLGLAPLHIGVLFLAEAATYGLMGSIFGYIVGQGVATALTKLGWLGGITLNYSGTQAIATMMMVLGVVVLSSLVPAYMAGKLAAPSAHMKWRVPRPENDVIRDTLPFTVTERTANGVVMFLYDYLDAHREGSIGHFSTDNPRLFRDQTGGVELLGVESVVWLAPYDLGVRQDVKLTIRAGGDEGVLEIDVELRRGSGQVSSWWKLNRVFLSDLRKQLLGWRKLKTERILEYIASGGRALAAGNV